MTGSSATVTPFSRRRTRCAIETAAPELDWLNKGVFISVGGRQPSAVIYETYLVE
jgi:Protein of unknown function (DUF3237)